MLLKHALIAGIVAILLTAIFQNAPGYPEWVHESLPNTTKEKNVQLVRFKGGDGSTTLIGRLHRPASSKAPPVVVLAHGLGLSQDCSLDGYVQAFTSAGIAAFTFDYATFGASEGLPRHDINPSRQIADLHAAIYEIRQNASLQLDATKIGLWGTSYGGGHVLVAAASQNPSIRAVVAQVPALASGLESVLGTIVRSPVVGTKGLINVLHASVKWALLQIIGKKWYVPVHGPQGSAALLQNEGDDEGYASLIAPDGGNYGWRNAVTVGSVFRILTHRPINIVASIKAPALLIAAENDTLCPAKEVTKAAKMIEGAEQMLLPGIGHFNVYSGDALNKILSSTTIFFKRHLK